jgi:hypothetical protein
MFAGDTAQEAPLNYLETVRNNTYADIADSILTEHSSAERARLSTMLSEAENEARPEKEALAAAEAQYNAWQGQSLYQRSPHDIADIPGLNVAALNKTQRRTVEQYRDIVNNMYERAKEIAAHEGGSSKVVSTLTKQLNSLISTYNRSSGNAFGQLGLRLPTSAEECINFARQQKMQTQKLAGAVDAIRPSVQSDEANIATIRTALNQPEMDIRSRAHLIDGDTPQELAAWDAVLEKEISEDMNMDVIIDQIAGDVTRRAAKTATGVQLTLSTDELKGIAREISEKVAEQRTHANIREEIMRILRKSPLTEGIVQYENLLKQEQSGESFAESLARQLTEEVARKEKAPYAHMHVDVANIPGTYDVLFKIRYRSPDDKSLIKIGGNDYLVNEHPGGIADGMLEVRLGYENRMPNWEFPVHLVDGDTKEILETVYIYADPIAAQISVRTKQADWNNTEQGRTAENPIEPDMAVIKTSGNNVLVAVQSPHDQTVIGFKVGGRFSSQELPHEGGTNLGIGYITFDATRPAGDYALEMRDRTNGRILDIVIMHWDPASKTLTPLHQSDMFASNRSQAEGALQQRIGEFDGILSLDDAQLADKNITYIQQSRMYEETGDLPAPLNFASINLDERIYEKYPLYHPDRRDEGRMAYHQNRKGNFSYSSSKRAFDILRREHIDRIEENWSKYLSAMRVIMQESANVIINIRKGGNEEQLIRDLDRQIHRSAPRGSTLYQYQKDKGDIEKLREFGIAIPSTEHFIQAAKLIVDQMWAEMLRYERDVDAYHAYVERQLDNGYSLKADGSFKKTSEFTPSNTPPEMDRRQITLANKIRTALDNSSDPRILAYNNTIRNDIALKSAQSLSADATAEDIVLTMEVVMADVDQDLGIGGVSEELIYKKYALQITEARKAVNNMNTEDLFNKATAFNHSEYLFNNYPERHGMTVRNDSVAGKIFLSIYNTLYSNSADKFIKFAQAEKILGIPLERLITAGETQVDVVFFNRIRAYFETYGYGHIFEPAGTRPSPTDAMIKVRTDRAEYADGQTIRVNFDYTGIDPTYHHASVYLKRAYDGIVIGGRPVIDNITGKLYVDIPLSSLNMTEAGGALTGTFKFKVAVWKSGEPGSSGLQGEFETEEFKVIYKGHNNGNTPSNNELSTNPDPTMRVIENRILNILKTNFIVENPGSWSWNIGSTAHDDNDYHAVDLNHPNDDRAPMFAPAKGKVVHNKLDSLKNPTLVLEHMTMIDGKEIYWYTKYLHMYADTQGRSGPFNAQGEVSGLEIGTELETGAITSHVGGFPSYGVHSHFVVFAAADGSKLTNFFSTNSINLTRLLSDDNIGLAMNTTATDYDSYIKEDGKTGYNVGKGYAVEFDAALNAMVAEGPNLIYDHSELAPGALGDDSYWIAYHSDPSQRRRVTWVVTLPTGEKVNAWLDANDYTLQWDPSSRLWIKR